MGDTTSIVNSIQNKLICWLFLLAIFIIEQQYNCPYLVGHFHTTSTEILLKSLTY